MTYPRMCVSLLLFFLLTGNCFGSSTTLNQNDNSPYHRSLASSSSNNSSKTSDCTQFRSNPVEIITSKELILHAIIDPLKNVLTAELIWKGESWIALGIGPEGVTTETMVGSHAVIGLPASSDQPMLYRLTSYDSSTFEQFDAQSLIDSSILQNTTGTVLQFTIPLEESNRNPISMTDPTLFMWAVGTSNQLGYHSQRGGFTHLPQTCTILTDEGVVETQGTGGGGGTVITNTAKDYRNLWVVHGICAAIAWAILVPFAIGSSLLRQFIGSVCFPQQEVLWFAFHRALNVLAILLTIVAFSIAVYIIGQNPNARHFDMVSHRKVGLAIFILCLVQALNGILRPHIPPPAAEKPPNHEGEQDEEDKNETQDESHSTKKTTARLVWEVAHRLLGIAILAMAWWQIQDGIKLFSLRYATSDKWLHAFWGVVGGLVGIILLLYVLQKTTFAKE
jgi:hypothetical protein